MINTEMTRPVSAVPAPGRASTPATRRLTPFEFLQSEVARVFDSFNGMSALPWGVADETFSPDIEVTETDTAIEVSAELPGMDEKDIDISVADGFLTIGGEKKFERDETKKNYRIVERSYGSFERSIGLPQGVDPAKVKAHMAKGVLKIEIPKPAATASRHVKIQTA